MDADTPVYVEKLSKSRKQKKKRMKQFKHNQTRKTFKSKDKNQANQPKRSRRFSRKTQRKKTSCNGGRQRNFSKNHSDSDPNDGFIVLSGSESEGYSDNEHGEEDESSDHESPNWNKSGRVNHPIVPHRWEEIQEMQRDNLKGKRIKKIKNEDDRAFINVTNYPDEAHKCENIMFSVQTKLDFTKPSFYRSIKSEYNTFLYAKDIVVDRIIEYKYKKGDGPETIPHPQKGLFPFRSIEIGRVWAVILWESDKITVQKLKDLKGSGRFLSLRDLGLPKSIEDAFLKKHPGFKPFDEKARIISPEIIVESLRSRHTHFTNQWAITSKGTLNILCGLFESKAKDGDHSFRMLVPVEYMRGICDFEEPSTEEIGPDNWIRFSWQAYNLANQRKISYEAAIELSKLRRNAHKECFLLSLERFYFVVKQRKLTESEREAIQNATMLQDQLLLLENLGF